MNRCQHDLATCFECRFTYYSDDRVLHIVSDAAAAERRRNWREVSGCATGDALVRHADWQQLADNMLAAKRSPHAAALVGVYSESGHNVHFGSISRRGKSVVLQG